jgi:hypothetical protein
MFLSLQGTKSTDLKAWTTRVEWVFNQRFGQLLKIDDMQKLALNVNDLKKEICYRNL